MADDQTVIDHLLQGRQALERDMDRLSAELQRLAGAVEQLDAVIDMVGSDGGAPASGRRTAPLTRSEPSGVTVNTSAAVKTAARSRKPRGNAPKSIRVHVLEMLAEENRDWSLSEIIDRIHAAGIQAHDDAVRSITIKLMKDGRVERVGRGQYRLARRGSARSSTASAVAPSLPADEPAVLAGEPEITDAAVDDTLVETADPTSDPVETTADAPVETTADAAVETTADTAVETTADAESTPSASLEEAVPEATDSQDDAERRPYTPPLNLGQPWR